MQYTHYGYVVLMFPIENKIPAFWKAPKIRRKVSALSAELRILRYSIQNNIDSISQPVRRFRLITADVLCNRA